MRNILARPRALAQHHRLRTLFTTPAIPLARGARPGVSHGARPNLRSCERASTTTRRSANGRRCDGARSAPSPPGSRLGGSARRGRRVACS